MLRLTVGPIGPVPNPHTNDIVKALRGLLGGTDSFVILDSSDGPFLQVAGGGEEGFVLEVQLTEGDLRRCTTPELSIDDVVQVFLAFARGDQSWVAAHNWQAVDLPGPTLAEEAEHAGVTLEELLSARSTLEEGEPVPIRNAYNSAEGWLFVAENTANDDLYLGFGIRLPKRLERLKEEYGGKFTIIAKARGTRYEKLSIISALDRAEVRDCSLYTGGWFPNSPLVRHALDSLSGEP